MAAARQGRDTIMHYHVLALFPEMIRSAFSESITGRALQKGLLDLSCVNIRDFAEEKRKGRVDDYSYGGGAGMIMQAEPVYRAYLHTMKNISERRGTADCSPRVIFMSPKGKTFDQQMAAELSKEEDLVFLCGHYEGIDQRVIDEIVTDEVSLGDFVLTGGELAALVMMDAVSRLVPGVLSNVESAQTESFMGDGLLEYPQYSRPETWHEKKVPPVLLSGDHQAVDRWRREQSLSITALRRPDLCRRAVLDRADRKFLRENGLSGAYSGAALLPGGRKKGRNESPGVSVPEAAPEAAGEERWSMVRNIVYDVGYVLVGYSWEEQFLSFGYDEEGVRRIAEKLFGSRVKNEDDRTYWAHYDMGDVTDEEAEAHFLEICPDDRQALEWYFEDPSRWCVYLHDLADTIPEVKKKGYRVYLLSNYPARIWKSHIGNAPFREYLDGAAVSYQERCGKPDERIYRVLLERYGLKAEECLFLDDHRENTEAAERLGFQTVTLSSKEQRRKAVRLLESLPPLEESQ